MRLTVLAVLAAFQSAPAPATSLDDQGALVGIDIDHASSRLELPLSGTGSVPFEAVGG